MNTNTKQKTALIIGAGPAGLTAALELLEKTDITPIILEMSDKIGGISRTEIYKGNRIDIGGHRFFSKSDTVMNWWQKILPIEHSSVSENATKRMLVRKRLSRIYFLRKFFDYPISLSTNTLKNLGVIRTTKIITSYIHTRLFPIAREKNLEDFFINRFGKELYKTFFQKYTEKVWGVSCKKIQPEWGAQRIKGISLTKIIQHATQKWLPKKEIEDIRQKTTETSLIGRFLYPKLGPGQMWEETARIVRQRGGKIRMKKKVVEIGLHPERKKISTIVIEDTETGEREVLKGDYLLSTMPIKDLVNAWKGKVPKSLQKIGEGLVYRDFLTVGLLLKKLKVQEKNGERIRDNWIYIQEPDVKVGRLQIFNNWSPYLVQNAKTTWVGLEYFCDEGDEIWTRNDERMKKFATEEMLRIGMIENTSDVLDGVIIRTPKAYPAYFGSYDQLQKLIDFLSGYENLFLMGRNGMHRYNNQDHSMLSAMECVKNIAEGRTDKENIWNINIEKEYHEEKFQEQTPERGAESPALAKEFS
ncbi:NAD(P)/FAD-dependent oxidoreductase [Candidatus Peregrinibacteria bacterium]|nr:MAG: NAD(P)/FAD-dependent oxidoreductase [Candidatus Peregrinibacteria bacterium]